MLHISYSKDDEGVWSVQLGVLILYWKVTVVYKLSLGFMCDLVTLDTRREEGNLAVIS